MRKASRIRIAMAYLKKLRRTMYTPVPDKIDLIAKYNLGKYADGRKVTIAGEGITALFPELYARYRSIGWTDAKIGSLTPFCAAWEDAVWGHNPLSTTMNGTRVPMEVGGGIFAVNYPCTLGFHKVTFNGPGYVYPDSRSQKGYGGTTLQAWCDAWIDDAGFSVRVDDLGTTSHKIGTLLRTSTWGAEGTVGAYAELSGLENLHLNIPSPKEFKSGRLWCGFVGWDMGSASMLDNLYCTGGDVGLMLVRSTPAEIRKLTVMNVNYTGVLSVGGAGSTVYLNGYECDDAPSKYEQVPQYDAAGKVVREAGGAVRCAFGKTETGITGEERGPWKGTIIAKLSGQFCADFSMDSLATGMVKVDSMFVVNPKLSNGNPQECLLRATVKNFECAANVVHVVNGPVYPNRVGPFGSAEIFWTTADGCEVNRKPVTALAGVVGAKARLGFQRWNGTAFAPPFNHATGTPAYVYGTGVATPPGGGTTPPVDPPASALVYSATNVKVTSGAYSAGIADVTVKKIVLTDFVANVALNYQAFAVPAGQSGGTQYIKPWPDGTWSYGEAKATVTKAGNVTTITLATPVTISRLGTWAGGNGALLYTASKLELYS